MTGVQTCALPICFPVTISSKTKQKEYCRDHHTEDYCYVTESKRIKKIYGAEAIDYVAPVEFETERGRSKTREPPSMRKEYSSPEPQLKRRAYPYHVGNVQPIRIKKKAIKGEAVIDKQAMQLTDILPESIVYVGTLLNPISRAIMIAGRIGMCNAHCLDSDTVTIVAADGTSYQAEVTMKNEERDIAFFQLPKQANLS